MRQCAKSAGILLLLLPASLAAGDDAKPAPNDAALAAAARLYRLGQFDKAEHEYRELLAADANLAPAQAGLARVMLGEAKIDEALDLVNAALANQPESTVLLAAKGDVQFRRGEMADAELSYLAALKIDVKNVRARLGLARLYGAYSMHRHAYDQIQKAHDIAPDDLDVEAFWVTQLPREERFKALRDFLAAPPEYQEESKQLAAYLQFLTATTDTIVHPCKLTSKVEQTEAKLEAVKAPNAARMRGIGLTAKINDQSMLLQLDTGASGIIIDSKLAERANLRRLGETRVGGFGNYGARRGYRAVAGHIRIGELEFEDCVVRVAENSGFDGLIGADVLESYLVDIDLKKMRLQLSPLPKRPEDVIAPTALSSESEEDETDDGGLGAAEQSPTGESETSSSMGEAMLPKDRYAAPEMANWTKVFRFGHMLLVPTSVNDSKPMLFLLDTGAVGNMLSLRAGKQVSKIYYEEQMHLRGLSGRVDNVYSTKSASLRFGHLEQKNKDIVTIDLSAMSRPSGTEVSGVLGYEVLMMLDVKLDYRDGLADFEYDPKGGKR